eukprot:857799-Amphidinium_carterae.2
MSYTLDRMHMMHIRWTWRDSRHAIALTGQAQGVLSGPAPAATVPPCILLAQSPSGTHMLMREGHSNFCSKQVTMFQHLIHEFLLRLSSHRNLFPTR